ncbi:AurF N-oxygenase family protein [Rhodococcus tukisamuensis]|uniref:p-aminobenzoate N-oxygenase AurF n=1 Tax=Rhodococcus tukisamuensis TaxID=168276 RepID=A0A1G6USU1_9NOCA|nr:diiron oxygenase [Rhodococcus tukisamuensis]SDD44351.1 P-aminobenzoate N-oxygenase AurF [Rhodococcus tukisamuensis]
MTISTERTGSVRPPVDSDAAYNEMLVRLSEGSVHKHFDPFEDIDWDAPDFAVVPNDPRWVLQKETDPLGGHPWYQAQPLEKQIEIGMWRQANVAKVGLQFENILIRGMMQYVFSTPNGSPEARYCTHEVIEECNHTMMFQEMVNRIGMDTPGMSRPLRFVAQFLPLAGNTLPVIFFMGVLAGEEPIDHLQKSVLREDGVIHPIMKGVMAIHVAEEARHISFAHEFLRRRVPMMSRPGRFVASLAMPLIMRILCDAIVVPPKQFWAEFDIPEQVKRDLFWRRPESRQALRNYFADVRMLAHDSGLMNPASRLVWKALKIDGKASRYRSEPSRGTDRVAA